MDPKITLLRAFMQLQTAATSVERSAAATSLKSAADLYASNFVEPTPPEVEGAVARDRRALDAAGEVLSTINDRDLATLNRLLPWSAMTVDRAGRVLGSAWDATKRTSINPLIDRRLIAFNDALNLDGKSVLEVGCFEGIHTMGCLLLGAHVTGIDGRMENILKTMARLWAYGKTANLVLWNLEQAPPPTLPAEWDILHHIGVLYHLTDPVEHLNAVLPRTRQGLLLDTHVADNDEAANASYQSDGATYRYFRIPENRVDINPFAGLGDHAKWLRVEDLVEICRQHDLRNVQLANDRAERNGRRITLWAFR